MTRRGNPLGLSGERFSVVFHLVGSQSQVRDKAFDICVEQTVEFPAQLIEDEAIRQHILGRVESCRQLQDNLWEVVISYAIETTAFEITQLLNVLFGNISLKPGIRVMHLELPERVLSAFKGPRFGIQGWREQLKIPRRPLLCSVLKPMGLSNQALAEMAYQYALGGIDLIKDDHGLTNQPFCPFQDRVERIMEAVGRANQESGNASVYLPNITASLDVMVQRAHFAKQAGAGGILISPGVTGFDAMRLLAGDEEFQLPILAHPAFLGSFVTSRENGISHGAVFGQITRLAGADATIFPTWAGRFGFTKEECISIVKAATEPMGCLRPIFPAPGGGMTIELVPELLELYGRDVIYLMGGGLHSRSPILVDNCRYFRELVERI
jgi:ribulose-bisphosphate carboxylase large chain